MPPLKTSIALIGAGQMGKALAQGFCNSGECDPSGIIAYDPNQASITSLMHAIPDAKLTQTAIEATEAARYVILAVKPQHATDVCHEIQPAIHDETIIISIIAGLPPHGFLTLFRRLASSELCRIHHASSAEAFRQSHFHRT